VSDQRERTTRNAPPARLPGWQIPPPRNLSLHGEEVMVLALIDAPGGNLKPQTTQQSLINLDT
jgi:hypothetical protein